MKTVLIGLLMSIMMIASPMAGCLGDIDDLREELESFGECLVYFDGVEQDRIQYQLEILNTTESENESVDNNSTNSTDNSSESSDNMENRTTSNEVWNITFYDARNETLENECADRGFVYTGDDIVSCEALICECDEAFCEVRENETNDNNSTNSTNSNGTDTNSDNSTHDNSETGCNDSDSNNTDCETEAENNNSEAETHPCNQENATGCED